MQDQRLVAICSGFRGRLKRLLLQYGAVQTAFFCLAVAALLMTADWRFRLSPDARMICLLGFLGMTGAWAYAGFARPLRKDWTDEEILGYLDRTSAQGQDVLVSLRDLSHPEGMREWESEQGKAIIGSVVSDLAAKAAGTDVEQALRRTPVRRWRRLAGALAALYVVAVFVPRDSATGSSYLSIGLRRLFLPYASVFWPQKTRLLVREPDSGWRVPRGEPFTVLAVIDGEVPDSVNIVYRSESGALWVTERMAVTLGTNNTARFTFQEMSEPVTFYCTGGDDVERRKYSVTVADRPTLTAIRATYTFPKYTRLDRKIVPSGQLAGLEGTEVLLEFTASVSLSKATLNFLLDGQEPSPPVEVKTIRGNAFSHTLVLTRSGRYTVDLVDNENLKNGKVERYEIRVEPDNPPEVTLEEPARDMILTPGGRVRVTFKAKDDYNLTELRVMLAQEGKDGQPLSDRITGPFWSSATTLHPAGAGDFDLDFLVENEKGTLKPLEISKGASLELWVRAVDCNPTTPGVTESQKVRLSLLHPTDFMDAVVLKAKDLMGDAHVGWFAAAGVFHDARKWAQDPADDKAVEGILEQQTTAERAAAALALRFPEIVQHMERNRMQDVFMSARLENIGKRIAELNTALPAIGVKIAAGQPASAEEAEPAKRKEKMANALRGVLPQENSAAWGMRLLYDRLADWVALQSVLLKTRRMEELQRDVVAATDSVVKKTLGREARELDDDEVREMKEAGHQQQTVHDMGEAVEKELAELILQADKDGRRKVLEALAAALNDLRKNRITDKLKRAVLAILDARGDVVRDDQKLVLETVSVVNRGLIKAGQETPPDPPAATLVAAIDDPRGRTDVTAAVASGGETVGADLYEQLEKLNILKEAAPDSLDETLQRLAALQEDVRNRTRHVGERQGKSARYTFLRTGLTRYRQGTVSGMLKKAIAQAREYGKPTGQGGKGTTESEAVLTRVRERLDRRIGDTLDSAEDAARLIEGGDFGPLAIGLQNHVHESAKDMRVYIQGRERLNKMFQERVAAGYLDPFQRRYLLAETNLTVMVGVGWSLGWTLAQDAAAQRETDLLGRFGSGAPAVVGRLEKTAKVKVDDVSGAIAGVRAAVSGNISDPADPERANEQVKPILADRVLTPLDPKLVGEAKSEFDAKQYASAAVKQEALRRTLSTVLVELGDLYDARVPAKKEIDIFQTLEIGEVAAGAGGFIEYRDEKPDVLAEILERDGAWLDERLGDPAVRRALIKRLREIGAFDPRYARLQSAYFQALAQDFQVQPLKQAQPAPKPEAREKKP